jgi:hypothetical protein
MQSFDAGAWIASQKVVRFIAFAFVATACTSGCNGDGRYDTYPASGSVTRNGQPIEGVELVFFARGGSNQLREAPTPQGKTDAQGRFRLSTYKPGDGAPAGVYGVAAVWMKVTQPADDPEQLVEMDQLQGRYANHETSGLTAEIVAGENMLPLFELP